MRFPDAAAANAAASQFGWQIRDSEGENHRCPDCIRAEKIEGASKARGAIVAALMLLLAVSLPGQEPRWSASFVPTGPEALRGAIGRTIDGISVYTGNICAGAPSLTLAPGQILIEANKRGLVIFEGRALDALLVNVEGRSPAAILFDVAEGVAIGGAVVSNTDTITMRPEVRKKVSFGLAAFAGLAHWVHAKLTVRRIDPEKVRGFALPAQIELARAQDCWTGTLLGITGPAATFEVRE